MTLKIAVIGESMVELQQCGELLKQSYGGDTINTALYLTRLTNNTQIKTSYVTAIGNDPFSANMLSHWQSEGIDTSLVSRNPNKQSGLYFIETDDAGERSFHYWRNDAAAKFMFDQAESASLVDTLSGYDAVYLSGITLAILTQNGRNELFKFLENFEGKVFFDNNYRPKLWASQEEAQKWYLKMLNFTDTAFLTFDDEQDLYGDENVEQCIERTTNAGVKELVIKRGGKECLVVEGESANYVSANQIDNIVDTTAAGDSFSAGFLAKRLCGGTAVESAASGHTVAGAVIQYAGAIIPAEAMPELSL